MISIDTSQTQVFPPEPKGRKLRELLTHLHGDDYLLVVDNSAIETFTTCNRYAYHYLVHAREGHARNAALTFGGAIHVGLEHIERDEGREAWSETDTAKYVVQYFQDNPTPTDEYRNPVTALEVLAAYRERRKLPDYQWEVVSDNQGPLIERPFEIPLGVLEVNSEIHLPHWENARFVGKVHVAWAGRIDEVVHVHNLNRVADHKTTSIAGDQFTGDFHLNNASIGYVWAGQQLWPEKNISGFCLNAIHLRKPIAGVPLTSPGPRGGKPALDFFRAYFDYSQERINAWEDNAMTLVEDFLTCLVREQERGAGRGFPMHTKWCFNKYGKCQFHDVCTVDQHEARMRLLHSEMYKNVTWDPTLER